MIIMFIIHTTPQLLLALGTRHIKISSWSCDKTSVIMTEPAIRPRTGPLYGLFQIKDQLANAQCLNRSVSGSFFWDIFLKQTNHFFRFELICFKLLGFHRFFNSRPFFSFELSVLLCYIVMCMFETV